MVFLLSLLLLVNACNASQDQKIQARITVFGVAMLALETFHKFSEVLLSEHVQQTLHVPLGAKRIKLSNGDDSIVEVIDMDDDDCPLEKIWHYQDRPTMFDHWHFVDVSHDHQAKTYEEFTISKKDREIERLACLQRLSKRVHKQKKLGQQIVAVKIPKNQIKRAAHHQHQPSIRCQKR